MSVQSANNLPSATVLVLNYNGERHLRSCMDSLFGTAYPRLKVVVVDNRSTDDSLKCVRENYPSASIIQLRENMGYARAFNLAMKSVDSECVVFLNNDIVVEPDWLVKLVPYIDMKKVAAVSPKFLFMQNKGVINSAGGNCDIFGIGWNRGNDEPDRGQYDVVGEVFYANGGALVTTKQVWKDVGPFDERYFMYGEDLDWCWRARLKGYKVLYVPSARIYHVWQGSAGSMIDTLEKHTFANFLKNYSLRTICVLIPAYAALRGFKAVWLLMNGRRAAEKLAVFGSFAWNAVNFKATWTKHLEVQMFRKVSDSEIQSHMYRGSFELSSFTGKVKHPVVERLRERNP